MSTTSLGQYAVVGTLSADTVKYNNLDPPMAGFVSNPLSGTLQCNGNDIGEGPLPNAQAADNIYCNTLNYTALNPPINPGVVNPLQADIDCNGPGGPYSITDCNNLTSGSATISTLNCTSLLNGVLCGLEQLAVFSSGTGTGNIQAGGEVSANRVLAGTGGLEVQSGDLTVTPGGGAGRANLNGGFDVPLGPAQNVIGNITHFTNELKHTGASAGTIAASIATTPPGGTVFNLPAGQYVFDLVCYGFGGAVAFDLNTTLGGPGAGNSVLEQYVIEVLAYCFDRDGINPVPTANYSGIIFGPATTTPAFGNFSVFIPFNNLDSGNTQKLRIRVKLSFPS